MIKDFRERIIKAREDNGEAAKIIKEFEPLIKKGVWMYIRDFNSIEDGLQEGRIAILNCIRKYDMTSPVPFEGYVKKMVLYTIRNFASKRRENLSLDEEVTEDGGSLQKVKEQSLMSFILKGKP
jgi:RNA polymerase sporulation-specific sigma factor